MNNELNQKFVSTKDVYNEDRMGATEAGYTRARIDLGSTGLFADIEPQARENGIKLLPDYEDNKDAYDAYTYEGWYNNRDLFDAKYTQAIEDRIYELDADGSVIPGEGHFFGADLLIDKTTYKGHLLAKRNNFDITPHYQEIVKGIEKKLVGAEKNAFLEIVGGIGGAIATPELTRDSHKSTKDYCHICC